MTTRKYGWRPDYPGAARGLRRLADPRIVASLPASVDMRPGMPPVQDQGNLGCHDDKTEVLTDQGWAPWSSCTGKELLGTMNPLTHALEFQAPTAMYVYDYDGPLVCADHDRLDFALTPNHRMYLRRWNERDRTLSNTYSFAEAQKIGWYAGLPHATSGFVGIDLKKLAIGKRELSGDDFLALVALVISDGWVGGTESNWDKVSFCCFREDRSAMVRDFAGSLGIKEQPGRPGVWQLSDAGMAEWFRANTYTGKTYQAAFKRVPDIVKTVNSKQVAHFLQFFGDQHIAQDSNRQFYSCSARMIDDLQELLLRIGKRGSIYSRPQRSAVLRDGRRIEAGANPDITLTEATTDRLSLERKKDIVRENYRGKVFCATVPNSLLVTRRNGSVLISGNSCTYNMMSGALWYDELKQKLAKAKAPSRLFGYYNERVIEGTVPSDAGASIADSVKATAEYGFVDEALWPYDVSKFADQPPDSVYQAALANKITDYAAVDQTSDQIKGMLASGYPVCMGFTVYSSFESQAVANTGMVPMPKAREQILGGHAVLIVGYDDARGVFIDRNSWGDSWGVKGYFYFPYAYVLDPQLASDFWIVRSVPGGTPVPPPPPPVPPVVGSTTISFPDGSIATIPAGNWKAT